MDATRIADVIDALCWALPELPLPDQARSDRGFVLTGHELSGNGGCEMPRHDRIYTQAALFVSMLFNMPVASLMRGMDTVASCVSKASNP